MPHSPATGKGYHGAMFLRPEIVRPASYARVPGRRTPAHALASLGELGDVLQGGQSAAELVSAIQVNIIDKQGVVAPRTSIQAAFGAAKATFQGGLNGTLAPAFQKAWDAWTTAAKPGGSDQNIYWTFGQVAATWADRLIAAANAQPALVDDPAVTRVSYTLMDTSQSGTTWYGGTVTTSKLTNAQWGQVFQKAWNVLAAGVSAQVLPFSYLTILCKGMLASPTQRKFPTFHQPEGDAQSAAAIAWRAAMKQLGWNDVVQLWFGFTQQAWAAESARADQLDAVHAAAITALNYASGKAIVDQLMAKVQAMHKERQAALASMKTVESVLAGPLKPYVSPEDLKAWQIVQRDFADAEAESNRVFGPAGLWPAPGMSGMGAVQLIIAGTVGVALLGTSVWLIALWTNVSRTAAAQAKQITDNVLKTVGEIKASCVRVYEASPRGPEDEAALQQCLASTDTLVASIPQVKTGSGGMMIAMLGIAAAGGLYLFTKK